MRTRYFKQLPGFTHRLSKEAARWRDKAEKLPQGPDRDALIRKAQQADEALRMDQWLRSPGLQPPK